ncbi:putative secreted protein (Por secretion system target) [Chitinophaga skermanii]|uniref:Putative secreted protein (Por secretion system target) n=1 Tax=Chitinophaga skermanii TaxID=331697 RepID=A0A327QZ51_9BACT|nr:tail fiber domain-containing protein [Chitinophaga skermanii]RAJ08703.1 putative secreted protein (Por secretion system target) [Chitinophaga skermanii]
MKKLLLLCLLASCFSIAHAQLKYRADGRLTLGPVNPIGAYTTNINGWGHYFSGDYYGTPTYFKICLGVPSPRISGSGDQVVFYDSDNSTFNSIQVQNVYNYSDRNAKANILPLNTSLDKLLSLNPVSYNWKGNGGNNLRKAKDGNDMKDVGFIAQEVEQVLPEAVIVDENGNRLLNYTAIVSLLTKSVQELAVQVDSMKKEIETLRAEKATKGAQTFVSLKDKTNGAALMQNSPNPFNNQAKISYDVPKITIGAMICVYDLQGKLLAQRNIPAAGKGEVTIGSSELTAGIYMYSLIVDNKIVDTKRMVITK